MANNKFKRKMKTLLDEIISYYEEEKFLKADGFDDAVIGVEQNSNRLIYSVTRCLEILILQGMSLEEATEYFDFNISGSYVGEKTPIWCYDNFLS
jgi:hypothetical protein